MKQQDQKLISQITTILSTTIIIVVMILGIFSLTGITKQITSLQNHYYRLTGKVSDNSNDTEDLTRVVKLLRSDVYNLSDKVYVLEEAKAKKCPKK